MTKRKVKIPREVKADRKIELDINDWIWFYYDQGFSIIPLKEKDKRPNINSWKKYIEERPTKEEIQDWIDKKLFKNIGVICGSVSDNLVVIDIDDKKIIEEIDIKLNKVAMSGSWVVETGKGYHFYCKYEVDPGDTRKDTETSLEYRANGGYVVAPPSIHPSGRKYKFLNIENHEELPYLKNSDVKVLFDGMVQQVKEKRGISSKKADKPSEMENIKADCIKNIFKGGLAQGKRNDTTFALANWYKHIKNLNPTEIKSLMMAWNKRNKFPLSDRELNSTVNSALKSDKSTGCKKFKDLGFCPYDDKKQCNFIYPNNPNIPNNTNNTNNPNLNINDNLIKHFLSKKKINYQNIGRGVHNSVCYIATYIEDDDGKTHTAVVTSDKKIYIDKGKNKNQIKNGFGLYYRDDFFWDVLDTTWSNEIIYKFLYEDYEVDIKDLFKRILGVIKRFIIYENERIYYCLAVDVLRSYFFFLFDANSRTHNLAEPGSGKTNQMMIFRALMFNPIASPDFSSASIYRTIEGCGGTILLDDFDDLPPEDKQKINRHIKVNYKRFNAFRSDGGRKFRPHAYDSYSHLVLNNTIGIEDPITGERVVTYPLLKHKDAPTQGVNYRDPIFKPIRDDCYLCLLQHWKIIEDSYKNLKVSELKIRDLELFQPLLSIAKVIGEDVYKKILSFGIEYVAQTKLKDLTYDWGYNLFEYLVKNFEEKKVKNPKRTIEFPVNEIATYIRDKLYLELPPIEKEKKLHQLRKAIGGQLSGYQFKKTRPHNCVIYHVNAEDLIRILNMKNLLTLFEERLGMLGLLGKTHYKGQKKIDPIIEKQPDSQARIQELKDFFIDLQKKGNKITYDNLVFNFDQFFIENAKREKLIGNLPDGSYEWRGN